MNWKIGILLCITPAVSFAQDHHDHNHPAEKKPVKTEVKQDSMIRKTDKAIPAEAHRSHKEEDHSSHSMTHAYSRNLPMNRNGSGTGWQPDNTPIYAYMKHNQKWMFMVHGNLFVRANFQNFNNDYKRGSKDLDAPNWVMGMAQRTVGKKGLLNITSMFSADRLVMGGAGYPLLFQTGETWEGKGLVDRQHPHDLISALSVGYSHSVSKDLDLIAYAGYPGEPAIGPTAFMHRISSISNPDAPLGHHWQDASHIVYGVVTAGARFKKVKFEFSNFTGREPDENRFDFDSPKLDSYSGRISYNPCKSLSLQASHAFMKSPEPLHPEVDVERTTASMIHSQNYSGLMINTSLVYGRNLHGEHHAQHSILAETNLAAEKTMTYFRFEWVQKSSEDLGLSGEGNGHHSDELLNIDGITAGFSYKIYSFSSTDIWAGTQATMNIIPQELTKHYGTKPLSGQLYLRFCPSKL